MKIVWERESVTVRDVYEALLERRKVAYTTVMTMMKILEQKKYLKKTRPTAPTSTAPPSPKGRSSATWSATSSTASSTVRPNPCSSTWSQEHDLSPEELEEIARLRRQP